MKDGLLSQEGMTGASERALRRSPAGAADGPPRAVDPVVQEILRHAFEDFVTSRRAPLETLHRRIQACILEMNHWTGAAHAVPGRSTVARMLRVYRSRRAHRADPEDAGRHAARDRR